MEGHRENGVLMKGRRGTGGQENVNRWEGQGDKWEVKVVLWNSHLAHET